MPNLTTIQEKIFNMEDLMEKVQTWRSQQEQIVFTNGCFDLLHRGHIEYLAQTADFGQQLIVAVNSDNSVKTLNKGDSRPLQDEHSRALIIASLAFVNAVIIFDDSTPLKVISQIKPDVLVKGGDYNPTTTNSLDKKYIVGSDIVKKNGGGVHAIQFVEGYSTSMIEQKIKTTK